MVQRIDNSDKHYTPTCYTEIKITNSNKRKPVENFVREFFYDRMILDENDLTKGIATIKDGANDIKDELADFSKENPEIQFSLRFINKRDKKTREEFVFINGTYEKVFSSKPPHKKNPKKEFTKPEQTQTKSFQKKYKKKKTDNQSELAS